MIIQQLTAGPQSTIARQGTACHYREAQHSYIPNNVDEMPRAMGCLSDEPSAQPSLHFRTAGGMRASPGPAKPVVFFAQLQYESRRNAPLTQRFLILQRQHARIWRGCTARSHHLKPSLKCIFSSDLPPLPGGDCPLIAIRSLPLMWPLNVGGAPGAWRSCAWARRM